MIAFFQVNRKSSKGNLILDSPEAVVTTIHYACNVYGSIFAFLLFWLSFVHPLPPEWEHETVDMCKLFIQCSCSFLAKCHYNLCIIVIIIIIIMGCDSRHYHSRVLHRCRSSRTRRDGKNGCHQEMSEVL